jgi:lysozyme
LRPSRLPPSRVLPLLLTLPLSLAGAACDEAPGDGTASRPTPSPATSGGAPAVASAHSSPASASANASAMPPGSVTTSAASDAPPACEDLVDARGATVTETDVAKRAPGRGPLPGQIRGVDASSRAPWKTLRDQGFAFGFAQAGFGMTANPSFADNWAAMKRCGLPRGAYHFVNADRSGREQAELFLATRGADRGEIPSAVDLEKPPRCQDDCCGKTCGAWQAVVREWVEVVTAADRRRPMIYAVEPFWNQCLCGTRAFADHPLWHPAWPRFDFPDPVRFGGFRRWDFYQYDGNVKVGDGVVDLNLFRGTRADLDAFLLTANMPPPLPTAPGSPEVRP